MANQTVVMVPSKKGSAVLVTAGGDRIIISGTAKLLEFLHEQSQRTALLGLMGGPGQNLFVRGFQLGLNVQRIPWFTLQELTGVPTGSTAEDWADAIMAAWNTKPEAFYPIGTVRERIAILRELTRVRLNIQEVYRKPAQLQYQAAFRDLEPLLMEGDQVAERFVAVRTIFADSALVQGAIEDEKRLERQIIKLAETLNIWDWLHPSADSPLPRVKGLGPSLGGALIAEIGDIRRFAGPSNLRSYARFGFTNAGTFPSRKTGEISSWNRYLARAVWLWSTDQMPRYRDTVWRSLYDWKKATEMQQHSEVVMRTVQTKKGSNSTVYDYTLKHLDSRAKRWVGSQLLEYVFGLWTAGEESGDPTGWYINSRWPAFFAQIERELDQGLAVYLAEQIPLRRRREPEVPTLAEE